MVLLGVSHLVVGGFFNSMGALITPMVSEFGIDVSMASLPITLYGAVLSLSILPVNILLEKKYMGSK